MVRACGLIRMSNDQQDKSPEQQRREVEKLAAGLKLEVVDWFEDHGISGDNNRKRDGFQAMLREASQASRRFDVILAWHIDRISRNDILDAAEWLRPLRSAGVRIITCCQGEVDLNSFTGVISFTIQQEVAKQYLRDLSRNMCRSLLQRGMSGKAISRPPYAYDRVYFDQTGRQVHRAVYGTLFRAPKGWRSELAPSIRVELVETVRWLFQEFTESDRSFHSLAADLNRRGAVTPNGRPWRHDTVREILSNAAYAGVYTFGKSRRGKYHQVSISGDVIPTLARLKRCDPLIRIEDHHPAIVPLAVFRKAEARLFERKGASRSPRCDSYILSGLLKCGCCGAAMGGSTNRKSSGLTRYYVCSNAAKGLCVSRRVPAERIEGAITTFAKDVLLSPRSQLRIRKAIGKTQPRGVQPQRAAVAAELAKLQRQIERGVENLLLADPQDVPAAQRVLTTWRARKESLEGELSADHAVVDVSPELAMQELKMIQDRLGDAEPAIARDAFKALIGAVSLFWHPRTGRSWSLSKAVIEGRDISAGNRTLTRQKVYCLEFPAAA